MDDQLKKLKDELIFKAGYIAANMGLNKSMGQLYGALYLSQKPVSLQELAKSCRMSKGNASINMRRLERWGAVKKVWADGTRQDHYEANRDIFGFALDHGLKVVADIMAETDGIVSSARENMSVLVKTSADSDTKAYLTWALKGLEDMDKTSGKVKKIARNFGMIKRLVDNF